MAALLDVLDTANLAKLTAYVQATTLVPGDDAKFSAKEVSAIARSATLFAKAGAFAESAEMLDVLAKVYVGTRWEQQVQRRVDTVKRRWRSHGALA